ncbi:MAG: glycogen/starch/alpha-glucan phosphorylase [Spirochaetes bacterium]|nr:glycogen/starch/alpha-glucan phosphorylase [Spirochaetota bacterium]
MDTESIRKGIGTNLVYSLAKDRYSATDRDIYESLALTTRDRLIERWIKTQQTYYDQDVKRVYYLSMEFLVGRTLGNSLINMDMMDQTAEAVKQVGYELEELREIEFDAGLGNGGLGRLAACFLDSMATLAYPAYGYGIRYEFGIFKQKICDGYQVEFPDNWLRYGNPWEIGRPEYLFPIKFYGNVEFVPDSENTAVKKWVNGHKIYAMAYDTPVPGYNNNTVNTMRLWAAKADREFDFIHFNEGDYNQAVENKANSETITKVLYPNDNTVQGKELRLKQEYLLVAASLQDIIRRYRKYHDDFKEFTSKVAIQLNDTHPALAIPELMRILVDDERLGWDEAWSITTGTFGYTNHTVLPEALEKWPVELVKRVLPRHLEIIYTINMKFMEVVKSKFKNDQKKLAAMSIVEEGEYKNIRMANLSIVGSHSVNGVAALHTEIIKKGNFKYFYELWPERFNNKTNGITQRRWLKLCNPALADLISSVIGEEWTTDLYNLKKLEQFINDKDFRSSFIKIKKENKKQFASYIKEHNGIDVDPDSLFDCQVKRIHEYKRQLLALLYVVTLYHRIKDDPKRDIVPRTIILAGKAAPGYHMAKLIIKLATAIGDVVNNDPDVQGRLSVVFVENYSVSIAERLIPAADLSEQISTAGFEASGTGNMKFALNGALTIGTLDGANVEIKEEVGDDNIFIFGLTAEEVQQTKYSGYNAREYYHKNGELRRTLDAISNGYFCQSMPDLFKPIIDSLLNHGDPYMLLADYESYIEKQEEVNRSYTDSEKWTTMAIYNVARMGKFSTDRTIKEYADDIWNIKPVAVSLE